MADGTITIDIDLPIDKFKSDVEDVDEIAKNIGNSAGEKLDSSFKHNSENLKKEAKSTGDYVKDHIKDKKIKINADGSNAKRNAKEAENAIKKLPAKKNTDFKANNSDLKNKANESRRSTNSVPKKHNTDFNAKDHTSGVISLVKKHFQDLNEKGKETHSIFKSVFSAQIISSAAIGAFSKVKGAIGGVIESAKQYALDQQTMNATWLTLTNSASKGKAMVNQINDMAAAAQNSTHMVDQLSQKFYAINNDAKQTGQLTKAVLTLQDAFGQSDAAVENFGTQFAQMMANGKVSAQDMMSIVNTFPKLKPMLLDYERQIHHSKNMTMSEMSDLMSKGKIKSQDMINVVLQAGQKFKNATGNFTATIPGMIRTVQSQMPRFLQAFEAPLTKAKNPIYSAISKWSTSKDTEKEFGKIGKTVSNGMNTIMKAFSGGKSVNVTKTLNNALEGINRSLKGIFGWIGEHAKDLKDITKDVGSLGLQIGKAVWHDFASILTSIGKMFGLVGKNADKSGGSIHVLADMLNHLAKSKFAIQAISKAIVAMAVIKGLDKLGGGIFSIGSKAVHAYKDVRALRAGLKGIQDIKEFKGAEQAFFKVGQSAKSATKLVKGLFNQKGGDKLSGALQSLRSAEGFKKLSTAGKITTGVAGAGVALDVGANLFKAFKDRHSATKRSQDIGKGLGAGIGGGIGLWFGGPLGATLGAKIGGIVGKWGGQAVNKFTKGWQSKKPPKKFWSLENLGYSAHNMWNGFTKGVSNTIKWFKRNWKEIGLYLINPIAGAFNSLYKHNKAFRKWVNGLVKGFKNAWTGIGKWFGKLGKNIQKAWKGMTKWFSKLGKNMAKGLKNAWKGITKWFSGIGKGIGKIWGALTGAFKRFGQAEIKVYKLIWKGITSWFRGIVKGIQNVWHGITSFFGNLSKSAVGGFKKAWSGITSWFNGIVKGIQKVFSAVFGPIVNTIKKVSGFFGKIGGGIAKFTGSLHFANGTDWRKRWGTPAILNDGYDSPETGNREGLIHQDGTLELIRGRNVKRWLFPGEDVINAKDMADMFKPVHYAKGTRHFRSGSSSKTTMTSGSLNKMVKELNKMLSLLKRVKKASSIKLKVKGLKNTVKITNKLLKSIKNIAKQSKRSSRNIKSIGRALSSLSSRVRKLYKTIKKNDFGKLISKEAKKASKAFSRKGNFASAFKKHAEKMIEYTKKLVKDFQHLWKKNWDDGDKQFKNWSRTTLREQSSFHSKFERGWRSLDSGTERIFRKFWSSMRSVAGKGMNGVIGVLNSGISKINGVIRDFGGSSRAVGYAGHVHYATGTGVFNNDRRPITSPTLAMVNDGNDSPETGNREALWRPSTGYLGVFEGRNVLAPLMPGDEIFNASEARELGITAPKFASGTGSLKQLYELAKKFNSKPVQTLKIEMSDSGLGMRGAIHKLMQGMFDKSQNQAQTWWTQLWKMVDDKINDGGDAKGLLKAVEHYGEGHRYVWGASGPTTFDCSGLVMYALKHKYGISYPHFSGSQYAMTQHISRDQAKMGDLVFWGHNGDEHVGVYAGGNKYFSAQSPSQGIHMNTLNSVVGYGKPLFGRVKGLKQDTDDSNPKVKANTALQKLIKAQVGKGFWRTIQKIADKYGDDGSGGIAGKPTGDHSHWMKQAGIPRRDWSIINEIVTAESSWDPHASNGNHWGLGQMSAGNMHYYSRHGNKWNPIAQLMGIMDYIHDRYGTVANAIAFRRAHHWYANGGFIDHKQYAIVGEGNGPEVVLPYGDPSKRERTLQLMQATIAQMQAQDGINSKFDEINKGTDMSVVNVAIDQINKKFDQALEALGIITSKNETIQINNQVSDQMLSTIYRKFKQFDTQNMRKARLNISGYQTF